MSLFKKTPEEKTAVTRMHAADKALNDNSDRERKDGITEETPEYQRLNKAANEAADQVSWWHGGTKRGH
jgi:hypothetical protein